MIDFIIYGIIDNGVMILGAMTGLELEKFLKTMKTLLIAIY